MVEKKKFQNKHLDFKKITVVAMLLALTTFVVVSGTLFFSGLGESSIDKTNESHTKFLEDTIIELKAAVGAKEIFNNSLTLGS